MLYLISLAVHIFTFGKKGCFYGFPDWDANGEPKEVCIVCGREINGKIHE